jgi:hypothetical protein
MTAGARLRQRVDDQYEVTGFTADGREEALIELACVTADVVEELEAEIFASGAVGPDGKIAPAVIERRQQVLVLHRLLGAIDFGDPEAHEQKTDLSTARARKAAQKRWRGAAGRKALDG